MIESPLLDQFFKERYGQQLAQEVRETARKAAHRNILAVLEARFGDVPRDLAEDIESVADEDRLTDLVCRGATCPDLEAFRNEIAER